MSRALLFASLILGAVLRLTWLQDMEYKSDEAWLFERAISAEAWSWLGMPSGVYLKNPGFGPWVFSALAWISGAGEPIALARAVVLTNLTAIGLGMLFAWRKLRGPEREAWLWGLALVCVNPIAMAYHRKIWAQSILPIFCLALWIAWWNRSRTWGALGWGLVGSLIGQIHMSGFFLGLGLTIWTLARDRHLVRWKAWAVGSLLGILPLLPWLAYLPHATAPPNRIFYGLGEVIQLKFWVFWITDPLGLHMGNWLGVKLGPGGLTQLASFLPWPNGTYLCALAHLGALGLGGWIWISAARRAIRENPPLLATQSGYICLALLFGYGLLVTATTVLVRRYYLLITFPFEFVFLAGLAFYANSKKAPRLLVALMACELFLCVAFLSTIHEKGGAEDGDYGRVYSRTLQSEEAPPILKER